MTESTTASRSTAGKENQRPRRWFLTNGLVALAVCLVMAGARFIGFDDLLIWWAGLGNVTWAQNGVRFVFTDAFPIFLIVGVFGGYLLIRGLTINGDTGQLTVRDAWVARGCGLVLIGYISYLFLN